VKICPVCSTEYADDVKFCPNDGQTLRSAAPASDLVGQVVADRYHVIKKLGEGGMGQVYLAEHVKMGRRSAIKVMNASMVHDPDAVARFNREAANASRISHPNVCAIYDFGETPDGLIYLAMEFIEGEPLTALLERDGALPVPRAVGIFTQVAEALHAAHDLGIVHRDLKPDNVMLTRRKGGGADVVKVVDFGIAKAVGGGGDESGQKVTKTGLVVGTPEFMSPEQLSGDKVDGRSDLYSLALVFYRMLTGKLPFDAATVQETMIQRLTEEPITLAVSRPDLTFPPGLQPVFDTALARSPAERYQAVTKFAADVASVTGIGRGHTTAVPQTRAGADAKTQLLTAPPVPPRKRSRVPVALGTVLVLGAGGAGWALFGGGGGGGGNGTQPDTRGVSRDTAASPTNAQTGDSGRRMQTLANRETGTRTPPGQRPVDSVAIDRQLAEIIDVVDPATIRLRATAIYDNERAPTTLRAQAGFMVAQAFFQQQRSDEACRWTDLALRLTPANENYLKFKRDQRCSA
jgi:eukaryotic-like serine/threonine-protein kinase